MSNLKFSSNMKLDVWIALPIVWRCKSESELQESNTKTYPKNTPKRTLNQQRKSDKNPKLNHQTELDNQVDQTKRTKETKQRKHQQIENEINKKATVNEKH